MKNSHLRTVVRATFVTAAVGGAMLGLAGTASAGFYGDPAFALDFWQAQTLDDCSLMATADVIGQLTGEQPSEDEIIGVAGGIASQFHDGPVYLPPSDPSDPDSGTGTNPWDLPAVFAHYGIHDDVRDDTEGPASGLDALAQVLDAGHGVVVSVNAETIWDTDGDRTKSDHSVVVIGVDTDEDIVILNDSGTDDGCGEEVPIDTFEAAWATSGHLMHVTRETI